MEILTYNNCQNVLKNISKEIGVISDYNNLYQRMKSYVEKKENNAAGIAAVQIGVPVRAFCFKLVRQGFRPSVITAINPELEIIDKTTNIEKESCLSLPGEQFYVERNQEVLLKYVTTNGAKQNLYLKGEHARLVQHELDHLNGVLIKDKGGLNESKKS